MWSLVIALEKKTGPIASTAEGRLNIKVNKITLWPKSNKIIFNEEKFKAMLVSGRKRREQREIKIYLNNKPLEQVILMKYLGIIMDHKFRFEEHISYAAERCTILIKKKKKICKIVLGN
jgi:hypothetical protein